MRLGTSENVPWPESEGPGIGSGVAEAETEGVEAFEARVRLRTLLEVPTSADPSEIDRPTETTASWDFLFAAAAAARRAIPSGLLTIDGQDSIPQSRSANEHRCLPFLHGSQRMIGSLLWRLQMATQSGSTFFFPAQVAHR
jgi:hypothetical protein